MGWNGIWNQAGAFVIYRRDTLMSRIIQDVWKDPDDTDRLLNLINIITEVAARPHMSPNFKLQALLSFSLHII